MMKLPLLLQLQNAGNGNGLKPAVSPFWLLLHALCCLVSTVLGFRFSRLLFFLFFSTSPLFSSLSTITTTTITTTTVTTTTTTTETLTLAATSFHLNSTSPPPSNNASSNATSSPRTSHVVVGRHGIRVRPWPYPNPLEVLQAHRIIKLVQREQRQLTAAKNPRNVIVVTPTYARATQKLHLTALAHTLRLVSYPVTWLVVEAGGVTRNGTAELLAESRVPSLHVSFPEPMPESSAQKRIMESRMRLHALRLIRDQKMEGIVIFADDSNIHDLKLFDEAQKVKFIGAVPVGFLGEITGLGPNKKTELVPVQGPACNFSSDKMEWAGIVLDSRLLWEKEGKPDWIRDLGDLGDREDVIGPALFLRDFSFVEPLGNCGERVLVWWIRAEAAPDTKYPSRWVIKNGIPIGSVQDHIARTNSTKS